MNRDVITVNRQVYNSIMLLGNVGGLFGLFVSVSATILGITNYQKSDNLLVSDLFRTTAQAPRRQEDKAAAPQQLTQQHLLKPSHQSSFKEYMQASLPPRCRRSKCLRQSKEDKYFERARERLTQELDLVKLLQ